MDALIAIAGVLLEDGSEIAIYSVSEGLIDHRNERRTKRQKFNHSHALLCKMNDYLGPEPLYEDGGLQAVFRVTKNQFLRLFNDIKETQNEFFFPKHNAKASPFAQLLYPLKTLKLLKNNQFNYLY